MRILAVLLALSCASDIAIITRQEKQQDTSDVIVTTEASTEPGDEEEPVGEPAGEPSSEMT